MRVRIVNNPVVCGGTLEAHKYRVAMESFAGKWLDVDTSCLFGNLFNCVSDSGGLISIDVQHVSAIEGDVRITAAKCNWCGATFLNVPDKYLGQPCPKCNCIEFQDLAFIDRIRPCQGANGEIIYTKKSFRKIETHEGPAFQFV